QPVLVKVLPTLEVAPNRRATPSEGQALEGAALYQVSKFGLAYPFLTAGVGGRYVDVAAADVTVHQGQAGNAQPCKVEVVSYLPGTLVDVVRRVAVAIIGQGASTGTVDAHPLAVAAYLHQAKVDGVMAMLEGEHAGIGFVAQITVQL